MECLLSGFLIAEVTLENLWAAGEDLTLLAIGHGFIQVVRVSDANLRVRERDSHVAGAAIIAHGVTHDDRRTLREAIAFHEHAAGVFLPLLHGVDRQGGRAGEGGAHAVEGDVVFFRLRHDALVQGRHTRHPRRGVLLHQIHDERHLRARKQNQLARDERRQGGVHGQAIGMEEGERCEHALGGITQARYPVLAHQEVGEEVTVGQLRALGAAGGAGGVEDERGGVLGDFLWGDDIGTIAANRVAHEGFPRHRIRGRGGELIALGLQRRNRQAQG